MAHLVNCLVKAMIDHQRLPQLVAIILDVNLLQHVDQNNLGFGVKTTTLQL